MDTMALLCNLYGNGPATLRRLRAVGCTTFDGLEDMGVEELADVLVDSPDAARRFLREAQRLQVRIGGGLGLDEEENGPAVALAPLERSIEYGGHGEDEDEDEDLEVDELDDEDDEEGEYAEERELDPVAEVEYEEEDAYAEEEALPEPRRELLVARALDAWRTRDTERAADGAARPAEISRTPETRESLQPPEPPESPDVEVPAYQETPLAAGRFEGLDDQWVQVLAAAGVESVESLATADVDRLAAELQRPVTRLLRLRFLARAVLDVAPSRRDVAPSLQAAAGAPAVAARGRESDRRKGPLPAPGPGASAAVAQSALERFSPSERPEEVQCGPLESEIAASDPEHRAPHTWSLRREATDSGGPFA